MTQTQVPPAHELNMVGYFLDGPETDRYHVQVYVNTGGKDPAYEWRFVRSDKYAHPYVFTRDKAEHYIKIYHNAGNFNAYYRLYRLAPLEQCNQ